ncbi:GVQW3 protein, partial [Acromyrmex charruanus]
MDQRICIKFCVKNTIKCAFRMLTVAYGEATLDRSNVYRWYKMFSEGREDVLDCYVVLHPQKPNEVDRCIVSELDYIRNRKKSLPKIFTRNFHFLTKTSFKILCKQN